MINIRKLESELWESADLLRAGSKLISNQYCMPILGLIFLRYAYSRFKLVEAEILKDRPSRGGRVMPIESSDFIAKSAIFLPKEAQYDYLVNLPSDIASVGLKNKDGHVMNSLGEVVNNAMQLVDRGMIADYAIHLSEKEDGDALNPHVHVMCPIRPLNPDGSWGAKQRRVYRLDKSGNRICDADGNPLFDAVPTTDWGTPETLEHWRTAWAEINNAHFSEHNLRIKIDSRSFERQGLSQIPTVHEGPNVREMERRGIVTEKGERNRWIRQINASVRVLSERMNDLISWIRDLKEQLSVKPEPTVAELLNEYFDQRNAKAWSNIAKVNNLKEQARLMMYLENHGIVSVSDLKEHIDQVNEKAHPIQLQFIQIKNRLHTMDILEKAGERYTRAKPVYDQWYGIFFKKSKEKYAEQHKKELNAFHASRKQLQNGRYLDEKGNFDSDKLDRDREKLLLMMEQFREEHKPQSKQAEILSAIRKATSSVSKAEVQNRSKSSIPDKQISKETEQQTPPKKSHKKEDYSLEKNRQETTAVQIISSDYLPKTITMTP